MPTHRPLLSLLCLFASLPLAFRCTYPLAAYAVVWFALFARSSKLTPDFDNQSVMFVVVFVFALYSYGANARGRQAWAAAGADSARDRSRSSPTTATRSTTGISSSESLIIGGPWFAGVTIRLRRQSERSLTLRTVELERDHDEKARAAVAEERQRIARELHDVVAHAISVVVVQARGGRKVLERDPGGGPHGIRLDRAHG